MARSGESGSAGAPHRSQHGRQCGEFVCRTAARARALPRQPRRFRPARTSPERAPARLIEWLDQIKTVPPLRTYDSFEHLASIIQFRYPRFGEVRSRFIAAAWGKIESDGRVHLLGDARHRWVNPLLYKREDAEAMWRAVRAPMLMVLGEKSDYLAKLGEDGTDEAWRAMVRHIEIVHIAEAGHMLHIERPEAIAPLIERFLDEHAD